MLLVVFFFVGLALPFASSNYEYNYDPNSNYNHNATIEDCDGPESYQVSENECFCYDEPENDMDYGICQKPLGPSGVVMIFYFP